MTDGVGPIVKSVADVVGPPAVRDTEAVCPLGIWTLDVDVTDGIGPLGDGVTEGVNLTDGFGPGVVNTVGVGVTKMLEHLE